MSRISQETAENVGKIEADKKFNELISQKDTEISQIATEVFKSENNFPVIPQWLFDDRWVRECSTVYLTRNDKPNHRNQTMNIQLVSFSYPTKSQYGQDYVKDKDGKVMKAVHAWEKVKEDKEKFIKKVKTAILSLGTPKKVRESIPEFAKYFEDKSLALTIVPTELIKEVRKGLVK